MTAGRIALPRTLARCPECPAAGLVRGLNVWRSDPLPDLSAGMVWELGCGHAVFSHMFTVDARWAVDAPHVLEYVEFTPRPAREVPCTT